TSIELPGLSTRACMHLARATGAVTAGLAEPTAPSLAKSGPLLRVKAHGSGQALSRAVRNLQVLRPRYMFDIRVATRYRCGAATTAFFRPVRRGAAGPHAS